DKSYPPILPGDPAKVWIVEGGPDALALHDIAKRSGQRIRATFHDPDLCRVARQDRRIALVAAA
ncbi:hypothetical protein, partial [Aeromonas caviae]|uniref:hypothetical protein n=1 Tax=Aeromonas caviae TaxID=648 RepID=UPI001CC66EE8